jgi:hypothetical protein
MTNDNFKAGLRQNVAVIDQGGLCRMLGIKVKQDRATGTFYLSHTQHINAILHRLMFADIKQLSTPMDVQEELHV